MTKHLLISLLLLLPVALIGEDRGRDFYFDIFRNSTDQTERIQVMESVVEQYLFSADSPLFRGRIQFSWIDIRKEDFSETAKATLLRHLADRTLPNNMIEQIRNDEREFMRESSWWQNELQQRAERENADFDVIFEQALNEQVSKSIKTIQEREIEVVPAIIPLLLGWLEYAPATPVLNVILTDSIPNTNYALHRREIFTRNVRLALARMGDKEIEQEFLDAFSKTDISIGRHQYVNLLQQMYYINSRTAINVVIESLQRESFVVEIDEMFPDETFSSNDFILLTLYHVILNYPLEFENTFHQQRFNRQVESAVFSFVTRYAEQFPFLKQWVQENRETLQIDRERFIIIRD